MESLRGRREEIIQSMIDTSDSLFGTPESCLRDFLNSSQKFSIPHHYEEGLKRLLSLIGTLRNNREILRGIESSISEEEVYDK